MTRAESVVTQDATSSSISAGVASGSVINPRELLGSDLKLLTDNIRKLLGSGHPILSTISSYYFQAKGKHIRPVLVLLVSMATSQKGAASVRNAELTDAEMDAPISTSAADVTFDQSLTAGGHGAILPAQRRLAEITEMIHTASLLHDDVIDTADTRRGSNTANAEYGNKMAILAGDFLLARSSVALARLRNVEVVELLSTVIGDLVEGEFMQLRNNAVSSTSGDNGTVVGAFDYYLEKTFMKTASLIAKSCRAAAVLGGCEHDVAEACFQFGRNLGLAFQLVDDMLDFTSTASAFGKPVNADLKLGLATAPVLYASEEYPELLPLIERQFSKAGDVQTALDLVQRSNGLKLTRELAESYCEEARRAIGVLMPSEAREALIGLTAA
ncbi:coq1 putative hexaprenyl diphosphate synthase, partial [Irineochytrium annulatum]